MKTQFFQGGIASFILLLGSTFLAAGQSCDPIPSGIVGWWPGEGNANDVSGNNNNGIASPGLGYTTGEVGQAFAMDSTNANFYVPASTSLDVGSRGTGLTIEGWIKPSNVNGLQPIAEWSSRTSDDTSVQGNGGIQFWIGQNPSSQGVLCAFFLDTNGNNYVQVPSPSGALVPNVWQHVAVTYDPTSGNITLYINGAMVANQNWGQFVPQTSYNLWVGHRPGDLPGAWTYGTYLSGPLDELSLYNRALSANEIAAIYQAGSAGKCPTTQTNFGVPVITGFSPPLGATGTVVNISGQNFSPTAANNIVYFGAVQATVSSATPTSLVVAVPAGATFAPITETVNGLTAYSQKPFVPTFVGTTTNFSLGPQLVLPAGSSPSGVVIADLDGDGKPDLAVDNGNNGTIDVYRNISTTGTIMSNSFAPPVVLPIGTGGSSPMIVADLTGDGKLDLICQDINSNLIVVIKNLCTPGNISTNSFAPAVTFAVGNGPRGMAVQDLDGDGKPEIVSANWTDSSVSVLRNTSTPGVINTNSFAPPVTFATGTEPQNVMIADIDGDGQPDLATVDNNYYNNSPGFSVLRNISTPGNIAFQTHVDFAGRQDTYSIAIGDLDGDGKPDVVIGSQGGNGPNGNMVSIYLNTSTPGSITTNSFAPEVDITPGGWVNSVALADLNGDGKLDIAAAMQLPSQMEVLLNNSTPGSISFASPQVFASGWNANGIAVGDLSGDGIPDIAFANSYDGTISVYQNLTAPGGAGGSTPPFIITQPTNETVMVGGTAIFSVTAGGAAPLSYQWYFDNTNITGATNSILTLNNVQPAEAGNYYVTVANAYGSTNSATATLTVNSSGSSCDPAPSGIVAWWPGEGNANDIIGGNNGIPSPGLEYTTGEVGEAFAMDATNANFYSPASPSLDVGAHGTGLTIECWINPSNVNGLQPIVEYNNSPEYPPHDGNDGVQLWIGYDPSSQGVLCASFMDTNGPDSELIRVSSPSGALVPNVWQHVAVTYDPVSGNITLYINGTVVASQHWGQFVPETSYNFWVDHRPGDEPGDWTYGTFLTGPLDELSLYDRPLSPNEIAAIYQAGSYGKCPPPPTAPVITSEPNNQTVIPGGTATFSVTAGGTPPLSYQWYYAGTSISGATNPVLTLNDAQPAEAGAYYVTVANAYGSTNSATATLAFTQSSCSPVPSGIVAWWPGEGNANDIIGTNNGIPSPGLGYTNGEVGEAFAMDATNANFYAPASPSLDVGAQGNGLTIEAWIDPSNVNGLQPIVEWNSSPENPPHDGNIGVQFWIGQNPSSQGVLCASFMSTSGQNANLIQVTSPAGALIPNVWQHVAVTYDPISGNITLYINGAVAGSQYWGQFVPETRFNFCVGHRPGDEPGDWTYGAFLSGPLDELSLYDRPLSSNEIAAIYQAGSDGKCPPPQPNPNLPAITAFSPALGTNGTFVNISGQNFNPTASSNIVYFGAVQAVVHFATPTNLVVTVPAGATFAPITETVNGLTAYSQKPFVPTFLGTGTNFALGPQLVLPAGSGPYDVVIADLDGDGKPDIAIDNGSSHTIEIYRNISAGGTITSSSFAPPVILPIGTGGQNTMVAADLTGDGKLDLLCDDENSNLLVVVKNLCTPGNIASNSFAPAVTFAVGNDPRGVAVQDLDGDGKPEIVVPNCGDSTLSIFRNISTPGIITTSSFAPPVVVATGLRPQNVMISDIDGDGQPDLVTVNNNYYSDSSGMSVLRNISTPGNIALQSHVDFPGRQDTYCIAIGDLDGDGKPDVVIGSQGGHGPNGDRISIYRNTSTPGTITTNSFAPEVDIAAGGWVNSVALADLNGDGKLDIAAAMQIPSQMEVLINNSTSGSISNNSFDSPLVFASGYNANGIALGDLNGDGMPDIAFANNYDGTLSIYQNLGGLIATSPPPIIVTQVLDHFAWNPITSPKFRGLPFTVGITARDTNNDIVTNYTGYVYIMLTSRMPVEPPESGRFVQGAWTGTLMIPLTGTNLVLSAGAVPVAGPLGHVGYSNPFNVIVGGPMLHSTPVSGTLQFTWAAGTPGFILETTTNISSGPWVPVPGQPVLSGSEYIQQIPPGSNSGVFYRLHYTGQ